MKISINIRTNKSAPLIVVALLIVLLALLILSSAHFGPSRDTLAAWQPVTRPSEMQAHSPSEYSSRNSAAELTRSSELPVSGGAGGTTKDSPNHSYYCRGWSAEDQWWQLSGISTIGYERIEISFFARGSATGPKNFAIEYSMNGNDWLPLTNNSGAAIRYAITADNKFLSHGPFALPADVNDIELLCIRFFNTDAESVEGSTTRSSGTNYIADILITGLPTVS